MEESSIPPPSSSAAPPPPPQPPAPAPPPPTNDRGSIVVAFGTVLTTKNKIPLAGAEKKPGEPIKDPVGKDFYLANVFTMGWGEHGRLGE